MNLISFLDEAVTCGSTTIEGDIVGVIRAVYNAIRIGVPIILIVVGMVGMGKAIAQQKEDEIKKAQSTLVKQAVAAVIVFLMFSLVSLVVGVVAPDEKNGESSNWNCVDKILRGKSTTDDTKKEEKGDTKKEDTHVCPEGYTWNGTECSK